MFSQNVKNQKFTYRESSLPNLVRVAALLLRNIMFDQKGFY